MELQNEELKQAREELEKQLEKYSDLYNFAPVGYFTLDVDGTIREANLTGAKLLGIKRSRLAGAPFGSFLTDESRRAFQEFLGKVCRGAGQETCEAALKGDPLRFIGIEGAMIEAGKGVRQCRVAVIDITRRRQSEEAFKASETRYRRLFESARDGILILDAETGRIADVNPFLIDMLGYPHEDFLGKRLWEIVAFKDIDASKAAFEELQTKGHVRHEDLPVRTKDGRLIAVEFVSSVYSVDHHKVVQSQHPRYY